MKMSLILESKTYLRDRCSCRMLACAAWLLCLLPLAIAEAAVPSLTIYDGQLENAFADHGSWGTYSFSATSALRGAEAHSISLKPDNWAGVRMWTPAARYAPADYSSLTFWINGGSASGQKVNLYIELIDPISGQTADYFVGDVGSYTPGGTISANTWTQATVSFDTQGLTYGAINTLLFQANSSTSSTQAQVYFTDIVLNARASALAPGATVNVSVDPTNLGRAVNPLVFGVAYGDATRNGQVGYTVRRWGGNSTTRYNWQVDVSNTASDYYFENIPNSPDRTQVPPKNNSADAFIAGAISAGARPLMTIPTIGWTPRADSALSHPYTVGFSVAKYGAQQSTDYWDPNAGNGNHTNGTPITGNAASDTSTAVDPSFEQAWIGHMQAAFGGAANGGVRYFTLDNEVMLWNSTHRDVHPNPPDEQEIWSKALSYGAAIKQQEPNSRVTGPVTWGYCDIFWSAKDNCGQSSTDRNAHGGLPFIAWYLQQNCANGRPVDYLDLHYYPQGNNVALSNDDSPTTAALRLRALKELYDPSWQSESWFADVGHAPPDNFSIPQLLPRVHAWIDQYCPNTKLAITEYNWGNDETISGAVAQAEALAIFAREGVDLATRWVAPEPGSVAENAFSIFLNYDGAGSKVAGNSIGATSSNADLIGAYAFDIPGKRTMVLLTNKDRLAHDAALSLTTSRNGGWKRYAFTAGSNLGLVANGTITGSTLTVAGLPPLSATLLVIDNPPLDYVPLVPARLLDTRAGGQTIDDLAAGAGALASGTTRTLQVAGRSGVLDAAPKAVVLKLTGVNPGGVGYITAWPSNAAQPLAANLSLNPGLSASNLVIVKADSGSISLYNGGVANTDVVADVQGYFPATSTYNPVSPVRLLDTRSGQTTFDGQFQAIGPLAPQSTLDLIVAGRDGVPANAAAVVLNVSAPLPSSPGFITAWASGDPQPFIGNLNLNPNVTLPNLVIARLGANGKVSLYNGSGAATSLVADLQGWFPQGSSFNTLTPSRLMDSRPTGVTVDHVAQATGQLGGGARYDLPVLGRAGVPSSNVGAVVLGVTATNSASVGYLTVWPAGQPQPLAGNLNLNPGLNITTAVIAMVGGSGAVSIYVGSPAPTDVVVNVFGWFSTH